MTKILQADSASRAMSGCAACEENGVYIGILRVLSISMSLITNAITTRHKDGVVHIPYAVYCDHQNAQRSKAHCRP